MKIISPFKDYYDFIAYQYGVDNDIIYNRPSRICVDEFTTDEKEQKGLISSLQMYSGDLQVTMVVRRITYRFHRLMFMGRMIIYTEQQYPNKEPFFRILTKEDCFNLITLVDNLKRGPSYLQETKSTHILNDIINFGKYSDYKKIFRAWSDDRFSIDEFTNKRIIGPNIGIIDDSKYFTDIYALNKKYNLPVISGVDYDLETHKYYITIPNLSRIQGLSGMFTPHNVYRDIVNFLISNKKSVDVKPPVEISNDDKIVKAGFDTTTSFRGREFPKKPRNIKRG